MLNTKNIRVIVAACLLFSVVGYFAFSAGSFTESISRVQPPASPDVDEEAGNTLQGSTHKGLNAPYKLSNDQAEKVPGSGSTLSDDEDEDAKEDTSKKVGGDSVKGDKGKVDKGDKEDDVDEEDNADKDDDKEDKPVKGVNGMIKKPGSNKDEPVKGVNGMIKKPGSASDLKKVDGTPEKDQKVPGKDGKDCKNYVVMIDAGSTGSRVHVYEFDTCVTPPRLLSEKFEMLKPGLSSFDTDTVGAAKSLDPLLKTALDAVPEKKHECTPVAVKATAGLRLLGTEKSDAILAEVRRHLENDYPFAVVGGNGVSIMEGKDEGVYAWITTNYLLGNIGTSEKLPTAAVFDLGGGSTQIVFEPDFADNEEMADGEHKYEFTFGSRKFTLYQFSHLGYGLMEGRNKINSVIVKNALEKKQAVLTKYESKDAAKDADALDTIINPCFPPLVEAKKVQVKISDNEYYVVNFKGASEASSAQCRHIAEVVLNTEEECKTQPCSFNGAYQPSLVKTFHKDSDMWVFSYFYDKTNPLGFPGSFKMDELMDLTKKVCQGLDLWGEVLLNDSIEELHKEPSWCLDLSFITAMLHTGYDIPLNRELKTARKINNNELGWCLGASLPLLNPKEGNWKCRVKETTP